MSWTAIKCQIIHHLVPAPINLNERTSHAGLSKAAEEYENHEDNQEELRIALPNRFNTNRLNGLARRKLINEDEGDYNTFKDTVSKTEWM